MHVMLVNRARIPVHAYGGTERVIWYLGEALVRMGHRVTYLVPEGSQCDFAQVQTLVDDQPWEAQIPADVDVVHFQFNPGEQGIGRPHLVTEHGNAKKPKPFPRNTVFVSRDHAQRYGSPHFVYNGLNWTDYGPVDGSVPRDHFHFLGKASWRVKNVQGAIDVALRAGVELDVLGGTRINLTRGFRWTWSRRIHFHGMVGGQQKMQLLNASRGMIFPVRWHEPFGLAVIESLYFGCPVFATPYGALPELVPDDVGVLRDSETALAEAVRSRRFDMRRCHDWAVSQFSAEAMARGYLQYYERVLAGETLHTEPPRILGPARDLPWRR